MIKNILIFIILCIIIYEIYLQYLDNNNENSIKNIDTIENKSFSYINNQISDNILYNKFEENDDLNETINPNMFGKPSEYKKNNIIIWNIIDPNPWNKIIYKYNEKYPFYFYIKIKIPSLNDYSNWKKIISNLDFDPITGEMIIPTEDEETALSIANLIISNFKGDLSLEDILNKNLIDISITKAKKYEVVKKKLIEQIMTNLDQKIKESFDDIKTLKTDLAKKEEEYAAYEGIEYSFF